MRHPVLVKNGLVYITVNSNTEGNYVWLYDLKTGSLRKGLHFDDQVDYILRLERLNPLTEKKSPFFPTEPSGKRP